jgi:hypothetical protein
MLKINRGYIKKFVALEYTVVKKFFSEKQKHVADFLNFLNLGRRKTNEGR